MSSHQRWPYQAFVFENNNYNQATCQPSPCDSASRHAVPENLARVYATGLAADQPAGVASALYVMPAVRRLLAEAQAMFPEPVDHSTTVMDMILDHRLVISAAVPPANGRHRLTAPRSYARRCRADLDAYWAQQGERKKFVSATTTKNVEPPVSVERSTMTWPPDLDGDVWDCAA